jgi:hypothetical protein
MHEPSCAVLQVATASPAIHANLRSRVDASRGWAEGLATRFILHQWDLLRWAKRRCCLCLNLGAHIGQDLRYTCDQASLHQTLVARLSYALCWPSMEHDLLPVHMKMLEQS